MKKKYQKVKLSKVELSVIHAGLLEYSRFWEGIKPKHITDLIEKISKEYLKKEKEITK